MRALEFATNFIRAVSWALVSAVGDNSAVLQMFANAKAEVGLFAQNRILRRLVYNWSVSQLLCWVSSEYNPTDPWSRLTDDCYGDEALSARSSEDIYGRLRSLGPHVVKHVWTLGLPQAKPVGLAAWGAVEWSVITYDL